MKITRLAAAAATLAIAGGVAAAPALATSATPAPASKVVVAYFPAWGVYGRNYHVPDIPTSGITHVNYAFANVQGGKCVLGDPYADIDRFYPGDTWDAGALRGSFNQLRKMKAAHPGMRVMISVGGWTWSSHFSDAALTAQSRSTFVSSCVDLYLKKYGDVFDGIDIDWEYPVAGGDTGMVNRPEDRQNYTLLMQEFRRQLDALEQADGQDRHYELSIAMPAGVEKIGNLDVGPLVAPLDFVNVMTYDFHGAWEGTTGFNAPLEEPAGAPGDARYSDVGAITALKAAGAPAAKLTLGVPFYGRGWRGVGTASNGLFQTATGAAQGTWEAGMYDYKDLAANYVGKAGWTRQWDATAKSPYLWNASTQTFISYDDPDSIRIKAAWAKDQGLAGVMFWEASGDTASHDLLKAIGEGMGGVVTPEPAPTPTPTPTPTPAPTPAPDPTPTPAPAPTPTPTPGTGAGVTSSARITDDWGAGYCTEVTVRNGGTGPATWTIPVSIDGTMGSLWSATVAGNARTGDVQVSGVSWNATLAAGASTTFGYCGTRSSAPAPAPTPAPTPTPAPAPTPAPTPGTPGMALSITSDWGSGFCAEVKVSSTSATPITWSGELDLGGTGADVWNAVASGTSGTVTVHGASWNATVSAGAPTSFGYCASRPAGITAATTSAAPAIRAKAALKRVRPKAGAKAKAKPAKARAAHT